MRRLSVNSTTIRDIIVVLTPIWLVMFYLPRSHKQSLFVLRNLVKFDGVEYTSLDESSKYTRLYVTNKTWSVIRFMN